MQVNKILIRNNGCVQSLRKLSSSSVNYGMKNFNKFVLIRRGTQHEKREQLKNPDPELVYSNYGVREPGYKLGNKRFVPPECIPELIVPDLKNCPFKPYVSYRVEERDEEEFTAKELFEVVYCKKIYKDFKDRKLNEDGSPMEPSEDEKRTKSEAWAEAKKCNNDLMDPINPYTPRYVRENRD